MSVTLSYVLEGGGSSVTIDAELGSTGDQLDVEYVSLVEQVLHGRLFRPPHRS